MQPTKGGRDEGEREDEYSTSRKGKFGVRVRPAGSAAAGLCLRHKRAISGRRGRERRGWDDVGCM